MAYQPFMNSLKQHILYCKACIKLGILPTVRQLAVKIILCYGKNKKSSLLCPVIASGKRFSARQQSKQSGFLGTQAKALQ